MGKQLTVGKYRGLMRISSDKGLLTITALDHRGSLKRALNPEDPNAVSYNDVLSLKKLIVTYLGPVSSALLLDPLYAAAQLVASNDVRRDVGLLVSVEKSGYSGTSTHRVSQILPGWGVEKIKRMGADAVKMLLYYNPDAGDLAKSQEELVLRVAEECRKFDIPFLLEPITYPLDPNIDPKGPDFAKMKPDLVIRSAEKLTTLGIDILKAEFPVNSKFEENEDVAYNYCQELDAASQTPWALLSAGVDYDTFFRQVLIASQAGASGFLAGRAIWQEVPKMPREERAEFLATTSVMRLKNIRNVAEAYGRPWYTHPSFADPVCPVNEGWYLAC